MNALALSLGFFGAVSAAGASAPALDNETLQPSVRASLVAKILDYDRTAAAGTADGFRIGVVFDPLSEDSRAVKALMIDALRAEHIRVGGVQAEIVDIPIGR